MSESFRKENSDNLYIAPRSPPKAVPEEIGQPSRLEAVVGGALTGIVILLLVLACCVAIGFLGGYLTFGEPTRIERF
jgi:hypothetical protein